MTPEQALAEIGALTEGADLVRELTGGPASDSYLVERGEDRWILRIDKPLAATLGLDRAAEAVVLAHVYREDHSDENIGPRLEYVDVERGLQLTRFIPGRAWTAEDLADDDNLRRVGRLLHRVHAIDAPGKSLSLRDKAAMYADRIGTSDAAAHAAEVGAWLDRMGPTAACLCHNDPIAENFIGGHFDSKRLYLVDWEYAALGDPFLDLAVIVQHHDLTEEGACTLLAAYTGGFDENALRRLAVWCEIYEHLSLLWQGVVEVAGT